MKMDEPRDYAKESIKKKWNESMEGELSALV